MSKIIAITDDLYERLKSMKGENESFSKIIVKNLEKNNNKERVFAVMNKYKKEVQKAFKGIDSSEYVRKIRKEWRWDRYAK